MGVLSTPILPPKGVVIQDTPLSIRIKNHNSQLFTTRFLNRIQPVRGLRGLPLLRLLCPPLCPPRSHPVRMRLKVHGAVR